MSFKQKIELAALRWEMKRQQVEHQRWIEKATKAGKIVWGIPVKR